MNEQDMFVFFNKHMTHIKIFGYTKRKYSLIYERLHRGTSKWLLPIKKELLKYRPMNC